MIRFALLTLSLVQASFAADCKSPQVTIKETSSYNELRKKARLLYI